MYATPDPPFFWSDRFPSSASTHGAPRLRDEDEYRGLGTTHDQNVEWVVSRSVKWVYLLGGDDRRRVSPPMTMIRVTGYSYSSGSLCLID